MKLGASYLDDTTSAESYPCRVNDNEVFLESQFAYTLGWRVNPYVAANIRTLATEAFVYSTVGRTRIAKFWDPVTSQQSIGFSYISMGSAGSLSTRVGASLQQIRAHDHTQSSDDPATPTIHERYSAQSGIECVSEASVRLDSAISYGGKLAILGSFKQPDVWSVRSENIVRVQVWKFIGVTLELDLVHDIKQTRRTQFRQLLTLGLLQGL
jgi:hypothetical protein